MEIEEILKQQRAYFASGATKDVAARKQALKKLKEKIREMEREIEDAIREDLGKSSFESYLTEVGMVLSELSFMLGHVARFAGKKRVSTPLAQFCADSYRLPSPYGTVLIMSPWNYPFMLTLDPLVDAIAAGNTVVVKPSAYSPKTSAVIKKLLEACFEPQFAAVVEGGREVNQNLLEQKFDYIFFTGGKTVGRLVMEKASRHLTPVTLELGGKSPCIVDETANLKVAAQRIVFGKFLNLGQTCVAPDYLLVQESVKQRLLPLIGEAIVRQFGTDPLNSPDYGNIINEKHFKRLLSLMEGEKAVYGGRHDGEKRIAPTVLDGITLQSPVMQEEIFGPILPVLTYRTAQEALAIIEENPTPLALYLFTTSGENKRKFLSSVSFGGGCVNDTIIHLATSRMGFGGVGESGMGSYHGKRGFDTFTHYKSIVEKKNVIDLPFRYQPYSVTKEKLIRMFLK